MTTTGHILIVDDDRAFVELYEEILEAEGYEVHVASTSAEAQTFLQARAPEIDVVLIDQRLQGPGGPDSGLELLSLVRQSSPFSKAIIVTGYATPESIARAFAEGVYDYLVKNGAFEALLKAKVRNAVEITSERRLTGLKATQRESRIRELWEQCRRETDRNRKGKQLEELIKLLFMSTPGFEGVTSRIQTSSEEIDLTIRNEATGLWTQEGPYLEAECKNWSTNVGAAEYRNFHGKFENKFGRSRMGFFFSVGGFTRGFRDAQAERRASEILIVAVDASGLQAWIDARDRLAFLNDLHQAATHGA